MKGFGIAGLQLELRSQDNLEIIEIEVDRVKKRYPWVQMVVASELSLLGSSTAAAQELPGGVETALTELACRNNIWLIPGSIYQTCGDQTYNTAIVINPQGEVVTRYQKMFPFEPYEKNVACGGEPVVFDVPGVGCFGLSICYDMWFPETTRALACMGAEVIIHPTLTSTIDRDVELAIARASAATNQCYFIDVNTAGEMGVGRSIVVGPGGEVIHQAGQSTEIIVVDIDIEHVTRCRERGWQGLGQMLKSYRDCKAPLSTYMDSSTSTALHNLGPLRMPESD
jgi:deaminated glutathione amidase